MAATSEARTGSRVTLTLITTALDALAVVLVLAALAVLLVQLPLVGGLLSGAVLVLALSWVITRTQGEQR